MKKWSKMVVVGWFTVFSFAAGFIVPQTGAAAESAAEMIVVDEDFNALETGKSPSSLIVSEAGGTVTVENMPDASNKSVYLNDTSDETNVIVSSSFEPLSGEVSVRMKFMQPEYASSAKVMRIKGGGDAAVILETKDGHITYRHADDTYEPLAEVNENTWYGIELIADLSSHSADVYVDGDLKIESAPFYEKADQIDFFESFTANGGTKGHYIDDLEITGTVAASEPVKEEEPQKSEEEQKEPSSSGSGSGAAVIYEAEEAGGEGFIIDNKHPGYTGGGFIDYNPNAPGGYVEWKVNVPAEGQYVLGFRYSHGKDDNRPGEVKVNGEVIEEELAFGSTGDFLNYEYSVTQAVLSEGENTVRLTAVGPEGGANIDHLIVYPAVDIVSEAEDAVISGAIVDNKHPGYTGTGFVDYSPNAPGGYIEWTVNVPYDGEYTLQFTYAHGGDDNRPAEIQVNGSVAVESLDFGPTGEWTTWLHSSAKVTLNEGDNVIRATGVGTNGGPNIDHLRVHNSLQSETGGDVYVETEVVELEELVSGLTLKKLQQLQIMAPEAQDPSAVISRIEFMAKLNQIYAIADEETYKGLESNSSVWEVPASEWHAYVLAGAQEAGYVSGYPDGTIKPDQPLTKAEMASMIVALLEMELKPEAANGNSHVPAWSRGAIGALVSEGIIELGSGEGAGANQAVTYEAAEQVLAKIIAMREPSIEHVSVVRVDALSSELIMVTLNSKFENFDVKDIKLGAQTAGWKGMATGLSEYLRVDKAAAAEDRFGNTLLFLHTLDPLGENASYVAEEAPVSFNGDLTAAVEQANNLVSWQMDHGGWTKSMEEEYKRPWDGTEKRSKQFGPDGETELGTIDNNATINEIRFISEVYRETEDEKYKESVQKGLDFLLTMQYPTGGFPQVYPERGKEGALERYSNYVTFNDNAMINVLELFDDIIHERYPFDKGLVDDAYKQKLEQSIELGIDYILKAQIEVDGQLTAWCAQHDPYTYEPQHARIYEHPSISGSESVGIVKFLMTREQTPEIQRAILGALKWFDESKLEGIRYVSGDPDGVYFVEDPNAVTWYRFYEIGTNKPIFSGRDGVIKHTIQEIEQERRDGYSWGGNYAEQLLKVAKSTGYYPGKVYVEVAGTASMDMYGRTLAEGEVTVIQDYSKRLSEVSSRIVVAQDGSGDYTSVQAAVDAVPANNQEMVEIFVQNGTYKEVVTIPADKPFIHLIGESSTDTVITYDNYAGRERPEGGTYGTSGSATVFIYANDISVEQLTIENSFDESLEVEGKQAVAAYTKGERQLYKNVRFIGNQDTLYTNSGTQYFYQCYIEGDVDFIFGGASAVFEETQIHSYDRGSETNNGYITAASTMITEPYGYLFLNSRLTSDAAPGTVYLGRPWHPSGNPDAIGSVVFMNTYMGDHIHPQGWTDMSGFSYKDARFFEYNNTGPGVAVNEDRRQLTDEEAAKWTVENVLKGWNPKESL
ncbi:pectate lyase [Marinicrinis lubricantis]|uniref:Pectate lyase n=1 Tax=Marinicrinis lubricantis TaxID=2086470 RepID=A0ABW1IUF9_9BACL